jgi:hypothetical protein
MFRCSGRGKLNLFNQGQFSVQRLRGISFKLAEVACLSFTNGGLNLSDHVYPDYCRFHHH